MKWFDGNPEAKDFVEEWLKMRAKGESLWSAADVLEHLQEEHGYPFGSAGSFAQMCRKNWPKLYRGVIA